MRRDGTDPVTKLLNAVCAVFLFFCVMVFVMAAIKFGVDWVMQVMQ